MCSTTRVQHNGVSDLSITVNSNNLYVDLLLKGEQTNMNTLIVQFSCFITLIYNILTNTT